MDWYICCKLGIKYMLYNNSFSEAWQNSGSFYLFNLRALAAWRLNILRQFSHSEIECCFSSQDVYNVLCSWRQGQVFYLPITGSWVAADFLQRAKSFFNLVDDGFPVMSFMSVLLNRAIKFMIKKWEHV